MILVTGASGQLGRALTQALAARGEAFSAVSRPEFDFEKPETVIRGFEKAKPGLVINAAAYTAVDAAETDIEAARAGNHSGPLLLAQRCELAGIPLIHVSTDYVFDGTKSAPYLETDPTHPVSVYGTTKRDGEVAILATAARAVIVRTAWVYSAAGKNFVRTMLTAGRKSPVLRVVADQRGAPTAAADLAEAILAIAGQIARHGWRTDFGGIFHATSQSETSWYGFAEAVFKEAAAHGYAPPALLPIATSDWPTPARRPADSRLDCGKLFRVFGLRLPEWRQSLPGVVAELLRNGLQEH